MTNPDLPPVVNLTLHDVNEHDLVDAALAAVQLRVPDWNPQESDIEVMLAEGWAILTGQMVFAINQLGRVVLDGLLQLHDVARKPAVPATGTVAITLPSTTLPVKALPRGAVFRVPIADGVTVDVATDDPQQINPADGLTHLVPVTAVIPGSAPNGTPANTTVRPVDVIQWIETARLSTDLTGGADQEVDGLFYGRASAALRRRSNTLVVAEHFSSAALDVVGVGRAKAVDLWDGTGAPGSDAGHVAVAVANATGGPCSAGVKTAVQSALTTAAVAGLNVHVVDPAFAGFDLSVSVLAAPGASPVEVDARVTAYLEAMLSPASWPWGTRLWPNDVIARVGNLPGVQRVTAVSGEAVDLTTPGPLMLPETPAITVTVT